VVGMLWLLPPLCWTGLIAYLGGSQWGGEQTASWIEPILRSLLPFASPHLVELIHAIIRKGAHVFEYAVLATLWRRAVGGSWLALALSVITASLDELHQSFEPGRGASLYDVLLDSTAAATALAVVTPWRPRAAAP
jgi:VanZ family protein